MVRCKELIRMRNRSLVVLCSHFTRRRLSSSIRSTLRRSISKLDNVRNVRRSKAVSSEAG